MIVNTKYSIGDTVYHPRVNSAPRQEPCPDCIGTRVWLALLPCNEELQIQCPTCTFGYESRGTVTNHDVDGEVVCLTIGSVRIDTERKPRPVEYMCRETGIGSGSVWDEKVLYDTREEAESLLPGLIKKQRIHLVESRALANSRRRKDGPGKMVAHYRRKIRQAKKEIAEAEAGLAREGKK